MSFLSLSTWDFLGGQVEGTTPRCFYSLSFVVGHLLKLWGGWSQSLCGGLQHFSVSPRPFGSLGLLGLGWGWA